MLSKKTFICFIFLILCLLSLTVSDTISDETEKQELQTEPSSFFVYDVEPTDKNIFQMIGSSLRNVVNRFRLRTRTVYSEEPYEDAEEDVEYHKRPLMFQRFRERLKNRNIVSTTTKMPVLAYYGALSQKFNATSTPSYAIHNAILTDAVAVN